MWKILLTSADGHNKIEEKWKENLNFHDNFLVQNFTHRCYPFKKFWIFASLKTLICRGVTWTPNLVWSKSILMHRPMLKGDLSEWLKNLLETQFLWHCYSQTLKNMVWRLGSKHNSRSSTFITQLLPILKLRPAEEPKNFQSKARIEPPSSLSS